jgi:pimeloyl-ACP methyl ester carboxylesterase
MRRPKPQFIFEEIGIELMMKRMIEVGLAGVLALLYANLLAGQSSGDIAGKDLRLKYVSAIDRTEQPYRLYVPSRYSGREKLPLVVALHGSSGNESTLFDDERYGKGEIKRVAEKYGVLLVSPLGRGLTEFRGMGETDVLCVLAEVQKQYRVDEDRIYLTGHSMGGTGSSYIGLHHPDVFAAVAPLAAAYSFPWLAANARHVPFWWIGGSLDKEYFLRGAELGVERMRQLGYPVKSEVMPGEGHWGPVKDFDRILGWLLEHRRVAHPREYVFEIDTPLHGKAYWTWVEALAQPGMKAVVKAQTAEENGVFFETENVARFTFVPDPEIFELSRPIGVAVNGVSLFSSRMGANEELLLRGGPDQWQTRVQARRSVPLTVYRNHPVASAREKLDMRGTEARLANWIADAMRMATGADVALYNRQYYRGRPIPAGTVDIVDLIQCSRPFDEYLVTTKLTGKDLLEILDDNVPDPQKDVISRWDGPEAGRLVQLSGARYSFDPQRPAGQRIVDSDLVPDRLYTVVMGGEVVERETILLAGRFKKLEYQVTSTPFTMALYGYAMKSGKISARIEGRVRQVEKSQ